MDVQLLGESEVGRIAQNIEKMGKLPVPLLAAHMFGKFLLGLGLGIVLGGTLDFNWKLWGPLFIALSVVVSIPGSRRIVKEEGAGEGRKLAERLREASDALAVAAVMQPYILA
jgi:hypothetical protein